MISEQLDELEALTRRLESGTLPLEEAVALYTKGVELAAQCQKALDEAKLKIEHRTVQPAETAEAMQ